jgi:hypothetical protein
MCYTSTSTVGAASSRPDPELTLEPEYSERGLPATPLDSYVATFTNKERPILSTSRSNLAEQGLEYLMEDSAKRPFWAMFTSLRDWIQEDTAGREVWNSQRSA